MAAIMYQSQLVESRTLRLKLPPPPSPKQSIDLSFKSCFYDSNIKKTETFQNPSSLGCWNFLDALTNISQNSSTQNETTNYVHPQQKRSSLVMSPKSLELCTENLGNESGTDIVENDMFLLSSLGTMNQRQQQEQEQESCPQVLASVAKKAKKQNFPPPLTTIRGSESLRFRPHREDGRLVIEVTKIPPSTSCFQAERSHGRLRLSFLTNDDNDTTSFDPEEKEEEDEYDDDVMDENEKPHNEEEFSENVIIEGVGEEREETGEETEEGVVFKCGVRMEKYERGVGCKEGDENENKNELLNWSETLWVATS